MDRLQHQFIPSNVDIHIDKAWTRSLLVVVAATDCTAALHLCPCAMCVPVPGVRHPTPHHRHHRPAADRISMKCGIYFVIYSHYFVGFRENNFPESGLM